MRKAFYIALIMMVVTVCSCDNQKEHTAEAVNDKDSLPMMTSYGVNTLISDSGVMKYRIVAERWEVNDKVDPQRWNFRRGIFLEQFDENFHTEATIQSDSAIYYNQKGLWYLFGNVRVNTVDGLKFNSEELYWDQNKHELYSNKFSHVVTPEREMQGNSFTSDEQMHHYTVIKTKGTFRKEDTDSKPRNSVQQSPTDTNTAVYTPKYTPVQPRRRYKPQNSETTEK